MKKKKKNTVFFSIKPIPLPQIYPNFGGNRNFGFSEFPLNHSNNFHFFPFKHPNTVPFHLFSLKQRDGKVVFGPIQTSLTDLFFAPIPSLQTIPFTLSRSLFLSLSLSHTQPLDLEIWVRFPL